MIGIYAIKNKIDGKMYIGKSINISTRFSTHKYQLKQENRKKDCNRYLFNAVKKYGIDNFEFVILFETKELDEKLLVEKEFYYINLYKTTNPNFGYNLRLDSSTKCIVHEKTKKLQSINFKGSKNPNYKNNWSDEQKLRMSIIAKNRHQAGVYNQDWKNKIAINSSNMWKDEHKKSEMAKKVSLAAQKYDFLQIDNNGKIVAVWPSIKDIVSKNPTYKWQNIYSVCNGYKKRIYGYVWKKVLKNGKS